MQQAGLIERVKQARVCKEKNTCCIKSLSCSWAHAITRCDVQEAERKINGRRLPVRHKFWKKRKGRKKKILHLNEEKGLEWTGRCNAGKQ